MGENVGDIGNFREERSAQQFLHAVARVALAHACHSRIHRDHQGRKAGAARAVEGAFGRFAAT